MQPPGAAFQPAQPIPFIPMVPPLANTFASVFNPTVTSALVDNLINNNPTPITLSSVAPTTVTSSASPQSLSPAVVQPVQASENDNNANTSSVDTLTSNTSQLFISSNELIRNEQNAAIQPPSSLPAMYQTTPAATNQQFVQSEGWFWKDELRDNWYEFRYFLVNTAAAAPQFNVPMYNMNQFNAPMQQPVNYSSTGMPSEAQQIVEQAFAPHLDPNSNASTYQQQFQPTSAQFNMPTMPQIQTFEAYPQVQTQITLQGMPPLTVNTPRIDPTKYS